MGSRSFLVVAPMKALFSRRCLRALSAPALTHHVRRPPLAHAHAHAHAHTYSHDLAAPRARFTRATPAARAFTSTAPLFGDDDGPATPTAAKEEEMVDVDVDADGFLYRDGVVLGKMVDGEPVLLHGEENGEAQAAILEELAASDAFTACHGDGLGNLVDDADAKSVVGQISHGVARAHGAGRPTWMDEFCESQLAGLSDAEVDARMETYARELDVNGVRDVMYALHAMDPVTYTAERLWESMGLDGSGVEVNHIRGILQAKDMEHRALQAGVIGADQWYGVNATVADFDIDEMGHRVNVPTVCEESARQHLPGRVRRRVSEDDVATGTVKEKAGLPVEDLLSTTTKSLRHRLVINEKVSAQTDEQARTMMVLERDGSLRHATMEERVRDARQRQPNKMKYVPSRGV